VVRLDALDGPVLANVLDDGLVVDGCVGPLDPFEELAAELVAVDHRELARNWDVELLAELGDLEAAVVDVGVGDRGLELRFRDRLGEVTRPLQGVAAGDVAGLLLGLALKHDHVVARVGDRRRGVGAGGPGADDHDVPGGPSPAAGRALCGCHTEPCVPEAQNSLLPARFRVRCPRVISLPFKKGFAGTDRTGRYGGVHRRVRRDRRDDDRL